MSFRSPSAWEALGKQHDKYAWELGVEWIRWSKSFDHFSVSLSEGSNADLNAQIGSSVSDEVPLNWNDRFVISLGAEYVLNSEWMLRAGYRYGKSPIPDELVTPLNGANLEHTVDDRSGLSGRILALRCGLFL